MCELRNRLCGRTTASGGDRRVMIAVFADERDLLDATRECRRAGFDIDDVYAPYAVHGLEEAMGLRSSRITWVCFLAGAAALGLAIWFQIWTSAHDWPLMIGGKAPNSFAAFIPVTFEFTVLVAGLATMLALFFRSRLRPGKEARLIAEGVTDDRFVIVLNERDTSFDEELAHHIFQHFGAESVTERGGEA